VKAKVKTKNTLKKPNKRVGRGPKHGPAGKK
jgi:hypothetical protein